METNNWKWFRYNEIFKIKKGKRLTKADMIDGEIPYIGATDSNNGITARISNNEHLHSANTITVSYNGSIAEAYYQSKPFWATDDVNVLYPLFEMTPYLAPFFTTLINKEKYRFNYGRKWDKELMNISKIKLPVDSNNNPDWQWIENYVKETLIPKLPQKAKAVWENQFDTKPLSPNKLELNTKEWQWFNLSKIFSMKRGSRLTKSDREIGNIPLVTAGCENEGVAEYISNEEQTRYKNAITIDMFGFSCYREYEFCCDDNILVLQNKKLNHFSGLFISSIISKDQYKCAYGRQYRQKTFAAHKIKLPAIFNDKNELEPDWQWMEDYIKTLPYSICL